LEHCECTEEDWECDYGYYRKDLNSPCVSTNGTEVNFTAPAQCDHHYTVTQGYRKVSGDTCKGGVNHDAIEVPCPGMSSLSMPNMAAFLMLIGVVLSLMWVSRKGNYDRIKDTFAELINAVLSFRRSPASNNNRGKDWTLLKEGEAGVDKDDEDFGRIVFDDNENDDKPEVIDDSNLVDLGKGKRKTEGRGLDNASKRVPILNKPGEKKDDVNLVDYNPRH